MAEMVEITGNTYPVRHGLFALGGVWDAKAKVWRVLVANKMMAENLVLNAPGPETKVCWECGREFTFNQCLNNGGDWQDGYCGC